MYVQFGLNHATKATIDYGKTVNYGSVQTITTATSDSSYTIKLDNLEDGTEYHLKIVAEDEEANVFSSDDYEFETLPMPKLTEVKVQQVRPRQRSGWCGNRIPGYHRLYLIIPKGCRKQVKMLFS